MRRRLEMVGPNGLEPSTSSVSGKRSNQLSYGPASTFSLARVAAIEGRARLGSAKKVPRAVSEWSLPNPIWPCPPRGALAIFLPTNFLT